MGTIDRGGRMSIQGPPVKWFSSKAHNILNLCLIEECKCSQEEEMKMPSIECNGQSVLLKGVVSLSIYTQFLYFVEVNGREMILNCKFLMKSLVI
jgi:hypothetical protein